MGLRCHLCNYKGFVSACTSFLLLLMMTLVFSFLIQQLYSEGSSCITIETCLPDDACNFKEYCLHDAEVWLQETYPLQYHDLFANVKCITKVK